MRGGADRDRPEYPDLKDETGIDPARWLYVGDLAGRERLDGEGDPLAMPIAFIKSLQRRDRLDAFLEVETDLGPRKKIIGAINQRIAELEGRDDRPLARTR